MITDRNRGSLNDALLNSREATEHAFASLTGALTPEQDVSVSVEFALRAHQELIDALDRLEKGLPSQVSEQVVATSSQPKVIESLKFGSLINFIQRLPQDCVTRQADLQRILSGLTGTQFIDTQQMKAFARALNLAMKVSGLCLVGPDPDVHYTLRMSPGSTGAGFFQLVESSGRGRGTGAPARTLPQLEIRQRERSTIQEWLKELMR